MPDNMLDTFTRGRKPPTLAQHVAEQIRDAIIQGDLAPGETLLLQDLAKRLDVSIMPVREALKRLQSEGLVEQPPQKEARVTRLSVVDLLDTYETRILLETRVIRRAAEGFAAQDTERLASILERYESAYQAGHESEGRMLHKAFHFGMYAVGGSAWILQLISMLWDNSERYRRLSLTQRGTVHDRRREHSAVLEACRRNDPDLAARELEHHLRRTSELVIRAAKSLLET